MKLDKNSQSPFASIEPRRGEWRGLHSALFSTRDTYPARNERAGIHPEPSRRIDPNGFLKTFAFISLCSIFPLHGMVYTTPIVTYSYPTPYYTPSAVVYSHPYQYYEPTVYVYSDEYPYYDPYYETPVVQVYTLMDPSLAKATLLVSILILAGLYVLSR